MTVPAWWSAYRCRSCTTLTRASGLPSYCPACGTWGAMAEQDDTVDNS